MSHSRGDEDFLDFDSGTAESQVLDTIGRLRLHVTG